MSKVEGELVEGERWGGGKTQVWVDGDIASSSKYC